MIIHLIDKWFKERGFPFLGNSLRKTDRYFRALSDSMEYVWMNRVRTWFDQGFPLFCSDNILHRHGQDRGIERIPTENVVQYRLRLCLAWLIWLFAGTKLGMERMLYYHGYRTPDAYGSGPSFVEVVECYTSPDYLTDVLCIGNPVDSPWHVDAPWAGFYFKITMTDPANVPVLWVETQMENLRTIANKWKPSWTFLSEIRVVTPLETRRYPGGY